MAWPCASAIQEASFKGAIRSSHWQRSIPHRQFTKFWDRCHKIWNGSTFSWFSAFWMCYLSSYQATPEEAHIPFFNRKSGRNSQNTLLARCCLVWVYLTAMDSIYQHQRCIEWKGEYFEKLWEMTSFYVVDFVHLSCLKPGQPWWVYV